MKKTPEGLRRVANAEERINRTIAEQIENQEPHGHGGGEGDDTHVVPDSDLKFDDLEPAERRTEPERASERVAASSMSPIRADGDDVEPLDVQADVETPDMDMDIAEADMPLELLLNLFDQATREEARQVNGEIMSLISSLGGSTSKYRRERERSIRAIVSEIYSPPRVSAVAKLCPSFGILPGFALDLTTHDHDGRHWDFDEEEMRTRAWAKVKEEKPLLLIGSPMCTAFSAWQHINNKKRDPTIVAEEFARGMRHLSFCCELYELSLIHI